MMRLQTFQFPYDIQVPTEMYLRKHQGTCNCSFEKGIINISKGSEVSFDTYWNSLSVAIWKNNCTIKELCFSISGTGNVRLKFGLHRFAQSSICLAEFEISLQRDGVCLNLPFWTSLHEGLLFCSVEALSDVVLSDTFFFTNDSPCTKVRLGLVITHFNRQGFVLAAIARLTKELFNDDLPFDISLVVVDNSQNLTQDQVGQHVCLIPNENVGGSGGFTRGLIYLKDNDFTHCLFMDDDASCEVESILRTFAFFSFAKTNEKLAISGTLLIEDRPFIIHEMGGWYENAKWTPIASGFNTCDIQDLICMERLSQKGNYGAWCYFAFSISDIAAFPFPFYVRGDDVLFSLQNKLKITTLNGIATYIDDFGIKENPTTVYLGFRATQVLEAVIGRLSVKSLLRCFKNWHSNILFSYNYTSEQAIYLSLIDFLKGPETFVDDIFGLKFRQKIKSIPNVEILRENDDTLEVVRPKANRRKQKKWPMRLTVNGLLIPTFLMKRKIVYQAKSFNADLPAIFKYQRVLYCDEKSNKSYLVKHDKGKILEGLWRQIRGCVAIRLQTSRAIAKYKKEITYLTSEDFWRAVFKL